MSRFLAASVSAVTIAATLLPIQADAHAIWFAQRARQLALIYGVGADDLDAVKRLPLINSVSGFDADGLPVKTSLRTAGPIPVVDSDEPVAIVAAAMDYGLWSKTPDGEWHNKGRDEVPTAAVSEHNFKYAVHLTQLPRKDLPLIAGHVLQLVPVGTAIPQKKGEECIRASRCPAWISCRTTSTIPTRSRSRPPPTERPRSSCRTRV
jgi:hypothetical protein